MFVFKLSESQLSESATNRYHWPKAIFASKVRTETHQLDEKSPNLATLL